MKRLLGVMLALAFLVTRFAMPVQTQTANPKSMEKKATKATEATQEAKKKGTKKAAAKKGETKKDEAKKDEAKKDDKKKSDEKKKKGGA